MREITLEELYEVMFDNASLYVDNDGDVCHSGIKHAVDQFIDDLNKLGYKIVKE